MESPPMFFTQTHFQYFHDALQPSHTSQYLPFDNLLKKVKLLCNISVFGISYVLVHTISFLPCAHTVAKIIPEPISIHEVFNFSIL